MGIVVLKIDEINSYLAKNGIDARVSGIDKCDIDTGYDNYDLLAEWAEEIEEKEKNIQDFTLKDKSAATRRKKNFAKKKGLARLYHCNGLDTIDRDGLSVSYINRGDRWKAKEFFRRLDNKIERSKAKKYIRNYDLLDYYEDEDIYSPIFDDPDDFNYWN